MVTPFLPFLEKFPLDVRPVCISALVVAVLHQVPAHWVYVDVLGRPSMSDGNSRVDSRDPETDGRRPCT